MRAVAFAAVLLLAGCLGGTPDAGVPTAGVPTPTTTEVPVPTPTPSTTATPTPTPTPTPRPDPVRPADAVPLRSLEGGPSSKALASMRDVIDDAATWEVVWSAHTSGDRARRPAVDFTSERVAAVVLDPSADCRSVRVTNVTRDTPSLQVVIEVTIYAEATCDPAARPFHFVAFEDTRTDFVFVERAAAGPAPSAETAPPEAPRPPAALRDVAVGSQSGIRTRLERLIQDDAQWRITWADHAQNGSAPPAVDFATEAVFVAFQGDKPSTCYAVRVSRIDGETSTNVAIDEYRPSADMVCADAITQPFHLVAFPKENVHGPVLVIRSVRTGPPPA